MRDASSAFNADVRSRDKLCDTTISKAGTRWTGCFVKGKEGIILTAETRDLQKFVLKHLGEGELFDNDKPGEMIRKSSATIVQPAK